MSVYWSVLLVFHLVIYCSILLFLSLMGFAVRMFFFRVPPTPALLPTHPLSPFHLPASPCINSDLYCRTTVINSQCAPRYSSLLSLILPSVKCAWLFSCRLFAVHLIPLRVCNYYVFSTPILLLSLRLPAFNFHSYVLTFLFSWILCLDRYVFLK